MRILYSPLVAVIITIIVGIICTSLYMNAYRIQQSEHSVTKLEVEVASAEAKLAIIESTAQMSTSSTAKERLIREQLLLQRPGEFIVQLPDLPVPSPTPVTPPAAVRPWQQWKELLF
jgi:hypothetical protein